MALFPFVWVLQRWALVGSGCLIAPTASSIQMMQWAQLSFKQFDIHGLGLPQDLCYGDSVSRELFLLCFSYNSLWNSSFIIIHPRMANAKLALVDLMNSLIKTWWQFGLDSIWTRVQYDVSWFWFRVVCSSFDSQRTKEILIVDFAKQSPSFPMWYWATFWVILEGIQSWPMLIQVITTLEGL